MYKNGKIHTTTMFFMIGVLMWLLYGGHYEEVAFAQGGEVEPTLAAEVEPTATAEAEPPEMPSETAVEGESFSSSQASESNLASDDAEKWANTAKELIEAVDGLLSASSQSPEATQEWPKSGSEATESPQGTEESTEAIEEWPKSGSEATESPQEAEESTEAAEESTEAAEEWPKSGSEPTESPQEAEESTEAAEESTEAAEESTEAAEESTEATEESTEATEESSESTEATEESSQSAQESTVAASSRERDATSGDMACFGTFGFGLTCLDHASRERAVSGWISFNEDNSSLADDWIWDMAVCPDNRMVMVHSDSISLFDGQKWVSYEHELFFTTDIACDANGGIWVTHIGGVSYFDGQNWTTTPSEQLATGDDATDLVEHVAIGPDGQVWVATLYTIATTKDGSEWTVYQQGQGFDDQHFFGALAVDDQGGVWVTDWNGLFHFDGTNWTTHENWDVTVATALTFDHDGNVWVGNLADGVMVFDGQNWVTYNTQNSDLISNSIETLAIDAQDRVWVGTEWGVTVIDGNNWTTYQMDNAELADNDISALAVIGSGPPLPQAIDKENGELSGQLLNSDAEPMANTRVELCVERLSLFFLDSPCEEQPLFLQTTTDADGNFSFTDLPVGRYVMTANIGEDEWAAFEEDIGEERVLVNAGEETNLSTLILQQRDSYWYFRRK